MLEAVSPLDCPSLQIIELPLCLVKLLRRNQIFRMLEPRLEFFFPRVRFALIPHLRQQIRSLCVGRLQLERPLKLLFSNFKLATAKRPLSAGNRLPHLAQTVAFLHGPHFQFPHVFVRWRQLQSFGQNPYRFAKLTLLERLRTFRHQRMQLHLRLQGLKPFANDRGFVEIMLQFQKEILRIFKFLLREHRVSALQTLA